MRTNSILITAIVVLCSLGFLADASHAENADVASPSQEQSNYRIAVEFGPEITEASQTSYVQHLATEHGFTLTSAGKDESGMQIYSVANGKSWRDIKWFSMRLSRKPYIYEVRPLK